MAACPYGAITVWEKDMPPIYEEGLTPLDELAYQKHRVGAAQKCTFNVERIDRARANGLRPGLDREATPACVLACPTECRIFGDVEDPLSPVSKYLEEAEKKNRPVFVLRPEAGTRPRVAYLW